jgi:hypothetical protein
MWDLVCNALGSPGPYTLWVGVYTLEGLLRSLGRELNESEPHCFVNPGGVGHVVEAERLEERFGCTIGSIEGSEQRRKRPAAGATTARKSI